MRFTRQPAARRLVRGGAGRRRQRERESHGEFRYAQTALDLQGAGSTVTVRVLKLRQRQHAVVRSRYSNSLTVTGSTFEHEDGGGHLECFGCSYTPVFSSDTFAHDQLGVYATGGVAAHFERSRFASTETAAALDTNSTRTLLTHSTVEGGGGLHRSRSAIGVPRRLGSPSLPTFPTCSSVRPRSPPRPA